MRQREGYVGVPGGKVWYSLMGEEKGGVPLIVIHGGPGGSHLLLKSELHVLADERPVLFYDQLGSGNSERPDEPSLWTTERFTEELACIRQQLGLDEVHLLGHSWGTMLAASYLLDCAPAGVRSAIFSSPCLSAEMWKRDADAFLALLPAETQAVIGHHEAHGTTDSEEYETAMKEYYRRHVNRLEQPSPLAAESRAKANRDVYMAMWGPSEFTPTGSLKTYDCTPRLHELDLPALFLCGRYDEASPESTAYYRSLVPGASLHILENSSHSGYLEEPETYIGTVRAFLRKAEDMR